MLPRRVVFYTRDFLVWMCRDLVVDECGRQVRVGAKDTFWETIVYQYSARSLTYPTDRLRALQGLANETQKIRRGDPYRFGLFTKSLPSQLLWYGRSGLTLSPASLDIPSWS